MQRALLLPTLLLPLFTVLTAAPGHAGTCFVTTETFTGGSNVGGWSFGTGSEVIETTGGNPGAYLHETFLDTFAPMPRTTTTTSDFTGDFRSRQVSYVYIDLVLFDVDFSADGRPLTLMLVSDNDTPADFDDDWAAYFLGPDNVPLPGQGWRSYAFSIPWAETSLPAGWQTIGFGPDSPATPDWNDVITDVDEVRFFYGDPTFVFIFQGWDLGMDNPTVDGCTIFFDGFERGNTSAWSAVVP